MSLSVRISSDVLKPCQCTISESNITIESEDGIVSVRIAVEDILLIRERVTPTAQGTVIYFIRKLDDKRWSKASVNLCPGENQGQYEALISSIKASFKPVAEARPKKLLVLINPVSGKGRSRKIYENVMVPLFALTAVSCTTIVSERSKHLIEVAEATDLSLYDGVVILGGDGTYTEVVSVFLKKTQKEAGIDINNPNSVLKPLTKPVCIVPTGTGNGAAECLYGNLDPTTITLHIIKGKTKTVNTMAVYCDSKLLSFSGCVLGLGFASDLFYLADNNLRCMGTSRYKVAPLVFIFKPVRVFDLELTMYQQDGRGDIVEKNRVSKPGCMMLNWAFDACDKDQLTCKKYDPSVCCITYSPITKMKMMKYLATKLMKKAPDAFKQDFVEIHRGNVIDIKLSRSEGSPPESEILNRVISIDGELFDDCAKPEYRLRMIENVITAYCSY